MMSTLAIGDVDRVVTISRVMLPDDANPGGNVHGGTILKMIEEAGWIAATRHCNVPTLTNGASTNSSQSGSVQLPARNPLVAALVRVEHMGFHQPVHICEVAKVRYTHCKRRRNFPKLAPVPEIRKSTTFRIGCEHLNSRTLAGLFFP